MTYTKDHLDDVVKRLGEIFVVLESGREYELHGTESYEYKRVGSDWMVVIEGMKSDEWLIVEFPLDKIEHIYTHRDV